MDKKQFALYYTGTEEEFNEKIEEFIKYMVELEARVVKLENHRHHSTGRFSSGGTEIHSQDHTGTPIYEEK